MNIIKAILNNIFVKNILLAVLVFGTLVFLVLGWLNYYTRQGDAVLVPEIRHMQVEEAIPHLKKANLRYEVIDSIYIRNAAPGSIVEMIPAAGSKVKTDRIVFITTNFFSVKTYSLPDVRDLSQRQALAMLKACGFEHVTVKQVPSPYKDLVLKVEYKGREAFGGEKIPESGQLVLCVSSGEYTEEFVDIETNEEPPVQDNSWF